LKSPLYMKLSQLRKSKKVTYSILHHCLFIALYCTCLLYFTALYCTLSPDNFELNPSLLLDLTSLLPLLDHIHSFNCTLHLVLYLAAVWYVILLQLTGLSIPKLLIFKSNRWNCSMTAALMHQVLGHISCADSFWRVWNVVCVGGMLRMLGWWCCCWLSWSWSRWCCLLQADLVWLAWHEWRLAALARRQQGCLQSTGVVTGRGMKTVHQ
jgi:hypothetical protein